ncbi:hypothetical protein [Novosphingobium resinovorum]|uniref:hypothetical protein n=1 Tax=Novosphingobium resinovorum TaxID=158500 RepID=UPI002ED1DD03|nr:hypothetical protein [Novosphingobium resinovorum]
MIDLTSLRCAGADWTFLDWAALQEPILGGVTQRVGRLGSRHSLDFSTPAMKIESAGRRAIALLKQAKRLGGFARVPQVDFRVGAVGVPLVNGAHTGGTTLAVKGLTPRYGIRADQALNITVGGRRYLYFAADTSMMDASGSGTILLSSPMRTYLAGDEPVELAHPVIEGWLSGNEFTWTLDLARTVGLQFTIGERA